MHDQDTYARAPAYTGAHESDDSGSKAAVAAETAKETAKDEARNVAGTAREQAGAVVGEARSQVQRIASQARDQATDRVRGQHHQLVDRLRGISDEFAELGADGDSPGKALIGDLGQRGRRVADYLGDKGPEGVVADLTDFARKRPFAFIAGAVAAGFLVGRLGKNIWKAQQDDSNGTSQAAAQTRYPATPSAEPVQPAYAEPVQPAYAEPVVTPPVTTRPVADPYAAEPYPAEPLAEPLAEPYPPSTQTYQSSAAQGYPPQSYPDPRPGGQS